MEDPFLFRFKKPCLSPKRAEPNHDFEYDPETAQTVTERDGQRVPVIDTDLAAGPTTKKADIEKGEDQKDRRMWGS